MKYSFSDGFTFIELIIVMSITAILSTLGIASFLSYSRTQDLQQSTYLLNTYLQTARANVMAQVKPVGICSGSLQSYQVLVCCKGGGTSCPTCLSPNNIELDVTCGNNQPSVVMSALFPPDISIDDGKTTERSFVFIPLTGGVKSISGSVIVVLNNTITKASQTITVTSSGVVQ